MRNLKLISGLFLGLLLLNSCNKDEVNRKRFAGEYTVEKIEFYSLDANNEPVLVKTKNDVGTITLENILHGGAEYEFSYVLDTVPQGFFNAWVHDDAFGPPVSRRWSIDNGNKNLLIIEGRNWFQGIEEYSYYTVEEKVGRKSTWTYYSFDSGTNSNYGRKEIMYLKRK